MTHLCHMCGRMLAYIHDMCVALCPRHVHTCEDACRHEFTLAVMSQLQVVRGHTTPCFLREIIKSVLDRVLAHIHDMCVKCVAHVWTCVGIHSRWRRKVNQKFVRGQRFNGLLGKRAEKEWSTSACSEGNRRVISDHGSS
eukprot:scaffold273961_cov19-Tisochrysis_lutea.AAC.1